MRARLELAALVVVAGLFLIIGGVCMWIGVQLS